MFILSHCDSIITEKQQFNNLNLFIQRVHDGGGEHEYNSPHIAQSQNQQQ